jgi:hypothetical protein
MKAAIAGAASRVVSDGALDEQAIHIVMAVALTDLGTQRITGYEGAEDGDVDTEHMDALLSTIIESVQHIAASFEAAAFVRRIFARAMANRN